MLFAYKWTIFCSTTTVKYNKNITYRTQNENEMLKLKRSTCFLHIHIADVISSELFSSVDFKKSAISAYSCVNFMPFSFFHKQLVSVTKFFAPAEIKIS